MSRMFVASQENLRNYLMSYARGESIFDAKTMARVWVDGVASLEFLLSEKNRELLQFLQMTQVEAIPDLAYSLSMNQSELTRRLQMLANFHLLCFEGDKNKIYPIAHPGPVEVMVDVACG